MIRFFARTYLILLCICSQITIAQDSALLLSSHKADEQKVLDKISFELETTDSTAIHNQAISIKDFLQEEGYLEAELDSLITKQQQYTAYYTVGTKYYWDKLSIGNADPLAIPQLNRRLKSFKETPYQHKELLAFFEEILVFYENNGHPFARTQLRNIHLENQKVSASLWIEKGPSVQIDSLINKGSPKISLKLLHRFLDIQKGEIYNEEKIRSITNTIADIDFLKELRPAQFLFEEETNSLYLYIDEEKANAFDGVLGATTNESGRLQLNGQIDLRLLNIFHKGEEIQLAWKSPGNESQDLKLSLEYPYIFNSPLWLQSSLEIFKQDSTFLNSQQQLALQYFISKDHFLELGVRFESSSNLLKNPQQNIETYDKQWLSLAYGYQHLDYKKAPRKGYSYHLRVSRGNRKDATGNIEQYELAGSTNFYFPIFQKSVLASRWQARSILSDNYLENELIRYGGLKSLRGFLEKSLSASFMALHQFEYRYMLDKSSYIFLFNDIAYAENKVPEIDSKVIPYAFGVGSVFKTKAGLFSISYALGKHPDIPFEFRNATIHFGLINQF